jgi:hypothetical protein
MVQSGPGPAVVDVDTELEPAERPSTDFDVDDCPEAYTPVQLASSVPSPSTSIDGSSVPVLSVNSSVASRSPPVWSLLILVSEVLRSISLLTDSPYPISPKLVVPPECEISTLFDGFSIRRSISGLRSVPPPSWSQSQLVSCCQSVDIVIVSFSPSLSGVTTKLSVYFCPLLTVYVLSRVIVFRPVPEGQLPSHTKVPSLGLVS